MRTWHPLACAALVAAALTPTGAGCTYAAYAAYASYASYADPAHPALTRAEPPHPGSTYAGSTYAGSAHPTPVPGAPEEAHEELAGSAAGVGRERPGRPVTEPADPEAMVDDPEQPRASAAVRPQPVGPVGPVGPVLPVGPDPLAPPASSPPPDPPDPPTRPARPRTETDPGADASSGPGTGLPAVPSGGPVPVLPPRTAPSPSKAAGTIGAGGRERSAELAAHILALGTGCALMGLGLGYLGVRLRRGL